MTYLLDTCILSKLRKSKTRPDPKLENWIDSRISGEFYISVITLGEIQKGIYRLEDPFFLRTLEEWFYGKALPGFNQRILPFDQVTSLKWGELIGSYQKKGVLLPLVDSLIAATAIVHDLIVVTENMIDFSKIEEVKVFNPWEKL